MDRLQSDAANADQVAFWNGTAGERWASQQAVQDTIFVPVTELLIEHARPQPGERVIDKNRPSAFIATGLEAMLGRMAVRNLVVCGVTTNCCVETTVRDAAQRDFRTWVVEDAVAEFDDERHRMALQSMAMLFAEVVPLSAVAAAWTV